jgi:hypothetical protein
MPELWTWGHSSREQRVGTVNWPSFYCTNVAKVLYQTAKSRFIKVAMPSYDDYFSDGQYAAPKSFST